MTKRSPPRTLRTTAGLFAGALAIRLLYLWDSADFPTFDVPVMDANSYHALALNWAQGGGIWERLFWQPFFFPTFLALSHWLSGGSLLFARVLHAIVGAATCALVFPLGAKLFDRRVGLTAAVATMLCGPLMFFEAQLMPTAWAALAAVVLCLLLADAADTPAPRRNTAIGLTAGLAVIVRPAFLPFVAACCAWLLAGDYRQRGGISAAVKRGAAITLGFALVVLPVCAVCEAETGRFRFMPASGGVNMYIGNNPKREATVVARKNDFAAILDEPWRHGVHGLWEEQDWFFDRVGEYIRDDFGGYLAGLLHKSLQMLSAREIPRNVDIYVFRQWSPMLSALTWRAGGWAFPFGLIFPLAVVGVLLGWRRAGVPVLLLLALYPTAVVLVFVSARYRAPLLPILMVLAAHGAYAGAAAVRRGKPRGRLMPAVAAGGFLAALLLGTIPGPFAEEEVPWEADLHYEIGTILGESGRYEEATTHFNRSLQLYPDLWTHMNAGFNFMQLQDNAAAERHFRAALELAPENPKAHELLGKTLHSMGRLDEARSHLEAAARAHRAR